MGKKPKPPTGATPLEKFLILYSPTQIFNPYSCGGEFATLAEAQTKMAELLLPNTGIHYAWIVKTVDRGNN